jgi:hypothetical protein
MNVHPSYLLWNELMNEFRPSVIIHTARFPPDLLMSTVSSIRTLCETALTMSYTVRAAMLAPVRASISTPVL